MFGLMAAILTSMTQRPTALQLIELRGLERLVQENVLFRQTWISKKEVAVGKSVGTCIYAMVVDSPD